ncbi:hypothetical protein CW304_26350 [Bacillus sp. UFRGS-B20]|nr:hypothetical protein CW304_26350 [Bacillus sp. UFRGS-B20]
MWQTIDRIILSHADRQYLGLNASPFTLRVSAIFTKEKEEGMSPACSHYQLIVHLPIVTLPNHLDAFHMVTHISSTKWPCAVVSLLVELNSFCGFCTSKSTKPYILICRTSFHTRSC